MDKNKSVHKLKIFPMYTGSTLHKVDRRQWMENQFEYWEVENTRISAYDGREDDLGDILAGKYPDNMSSGELDGTSHLKAISYWLKTPMMSML